MHNSIKKFQKVYNIDFLYSSYNIEELLFFDIETTGFSIEHSNVYLIGCMYYKNNHWVFQQFFAQSISEEYEVINKFFQLSNSFKYIVHFNGATFDIPYLEKKAAILNIESPIRKLKSIDILKDIRPFQNILGLENCKLKTIEAYLNIKRTDPYTGGELIKQYYEYCNNPNDILLNNLLLHNEEDICGLLEVFKIYDYIDFLKELINPHFILDILDIKIYINKILFTLKVLKPSPFSQTIKNDTWVCRIHKTKAILDFEALLINDTLYHYFPNYKDYYFLPEQDEAIHKSIGAFLHKEKRTPASSSNCYIKKTGFFLQIMSKDTNLPIFKRVNNAKDNFVFIDSNSILDNKKLLIESALGFIKSIIKNSK